MTIGIQGAATALATLDNLSHSAVAAGAPPPANDTGANAPASAIIDLSSLAAGPGAAASQANSLSLADAAVASGGLIESLLAQLRQDAVTASAPGLDADARAALSSSFQGGLGQIKAAVAAASVGGVHLLDGSASEGPDGLPAFDFSLGGPLIGVAAGASLADAATSASLADQLGAALDGVGQAVGQIASRGDALLSEVLGGPTGTGVSGVNPGFDADAARLAALQIQQQLSAGQGSIANHASQAILALFR
jgi:flagellin-like hook-associated protein FlgL